MVLSVNDLVNAGKQCFVAGLNNVRHQSFPFPNFAVVNQMLMG
jgi:hypothetical protein